MEAIHPETARKSEFKQWEIDQAHRVIDEQRGEIGTAKPSPITLGKIVLGVFLGNLLASVVIGIAYAVITHN